MDTNENNHSMPVPIKEATSDDNGEIIPMSEGLGEKKDIEYSEKFVKANYKKPISTEFGISENDPQVNKYLKSSADFRKHKALYTVGELYDFVVKAEMNGAKDLTNALFMKASDRILSDAFNMSNGSINVKDYYWELDSELVYHSRVHITPQEPGNLPRSNNDLVYALCHINEGEVYSAVKKKNGYSKIQIGVAREDGENIIITFLCKGRDTGVPTIRIKTVWGVTYEMYDKYKKGKATNGRRTFESDNNPRLASK